MTKDHDDKGGKRPFGKRPFDRAARPGDQPRPNSPRDGKFRDDKPRDARSRDDRPRDDRPRDDSRGPRFAEDAAPEESERIAKRLARAGIASRREAETMIAAGRIAVNGKVLTSPAINVKRTDVITVDTKPLPQTERTRLWLYHKPSGLVTTNRDPEGRPTVFERLPEDMPRVLSVGRLDINTEGLLLLTNDGGLSRILELPATGWLRRYRVRAHGSVTQAQLDELKNGIAVDGVFYGSIEAVLEREQGSNVWLMVGLREGKNREVKNILGALGLTVSRLIRISFGPFQLGDLEEGAVREIRGRVLRDQLGEKLIEDSGADFDGPVLNEFSNAAVQGIEEERPARRPREWISSTVERPKAPRGDKGARPDRGGPDRGGPGRGERPDRGDRPERGGFDRGADRGAPSRDGATRGGPIRGDRPDRAPRADKPDRDERRGAALSRLTTKPERGELPARRPRGVNVWMAPGARPQTTKPFRDESAERPARREHSGEGRSDTGHRQRDDRRDDRRDERREGDARTHRPARPSGDFHTRPRREGDAPAGRPPAGRPYEKRPASHDSRPRDEGDRRPRREGDAPAGRPPAGRPYEKRPAASHDNRPPRAEGDRRPQRDGEVKRPGKRERREAAEGTGSSGGFRPERPFGERNAGGDRGGERGGERRFEGRSTPRSDAPRGAPNKGPHSGGPRGGPGGGSGGGSAGGSGARSGDGPNKGPGNGPRGPNKGPGGRGADRRR